MIVELRQYLLHPGQRDVLIDLFDREFVETQEEVGMAVPGQFRDLDRPDHFVWLRGFTDMAARRMGLEALLRRPRLEGARHDDRLRRRAAPAVGAASAYAENDFPALPVRAGEHALVALARPGFTATDLDGLTRTDHLRLMPTERSALR